jgi:copper transport protein
MRWLRLLFLALLVLGAALLARPPVAWAHALLVRSDPPANARLLKPPARISAWFSEPIQPGVSALRVLDGSGRQVSEEPVTVDLADPTRMSVALPGDLPPGFYLVVWETLSRVDGHFRLGSFEFIVLNPDGSLPTGPRLAATPATGRSPVGALPAALVKFAALLGTAVVVGGALFTLAVTRPAIEAVSAVGTARAYRAFGGHWWRLALIGMVLLLFTGAAELLLQARPLGGATAAGVVLRTTWGERWLWRQAALLLLAGALAAWWRTDARHGGGWGWPPGLALLAGAAYLLLTSATSHAAALPDGSAWAILFDVVHLGAATVWVGGLLCLVDLLRWGGRAVPEPERAAVQATAVRRFSLMAATSVVLLLATGLLNALVHVASWSALGQTAYGRVLTAKLLLTAPLLAVAGANAFLLRPRFVRAALQGEAASALRRRLTRLVAVEAAVAVAVLLVVGLLVQEPPARLTAGGGRGPFAYPLVVGNWALPGGVLVLVAGIVLWLWSSAQRGRTAASAAPLRALRFALPLAGLALALAGVATPAATLPSPRPTATPLPRAGEGPGVRAGQPGETVVALRYQAPDGRFVLLEVTPWAVGTNQFRVTVLDAEGQPLTVPGVTLRLSRLEQEETPRAVPAVAVPGERALQAEAALPATGWWAIEVDVAGNENGTVRFYLRLDQPPGAPLHVAPPDYPSDPAAAQLFRRTVARFEGLTGLRWREELTSGLLAPTGIGAWVLTTGAAAAPDRLRLHVLSPGYSEYELVRVGGVSCTRPRGQRWRCERSEAENPFDLGYQASATAFRLGRRERVDGEMTRVLLFYNPAQPAWYAWWVGEESGELRRQAMVAPGHVMLTHFFDHDVSVVIALPPEAR